MYNALAAALHAGLEKCRLDSIPGSQDFVLYRPGLRLVLGRRFLHLPIGRSVGKLSPYCMHIRLVETAKTGFIVMPRLCPHFIPA